MQIAVNGRNASLFLRKRARERERGGRGRGRGDREAEELVEKEKAMFSFI